MRYKTFGRRTGLRVSEVALGAGNFGTKWGYGSEPDASRAMFDAYATAGGNFIDTSDNYQFGQSEELVGEFISGERDRFVIERVDKIRLEPDRPIEPGQGVLLPAEQLQGNADAVAGLGIAGIERMRPLVDGDDLFKSSQAQHAGGAHHQRWNVVRPLLQAPREIAQRVLQPSGLVKQGAAFVRRVPVAESACVLKGQ